MQPQEQLADLRDLLVILVFIGLPLAGRILRALSERRGGKGPGSRAEPDGNEQHVAALERKGEELWERIFKSERQADPSEVAFPDTEPEPTIVQVVREPVAVAPIPRALAAAPRLVGGMAEPSALGAGLGRPLSDASFGGELSSPLGAEPLIAGDHFGGELRSTPASSGSGGAWSGAAPARGPSVWRLPTDEWRRAIVLSEILAPPVALRRGDAPPVPPGLH